MDIEKALRKAYSLGQRYWQQADSEYVSQNKKASATEAEFYALISSVMAELSAPVPAMPMQGSPLSDEEIQEIRNRAKLNDNRQIDPMSFARDIERAVLAKAMPMQDDRISKEWKEIWNPIDELVRPLTPLGHSVAVKAVELIKQALAMPIPKQEPVGAVPDVNFIASTLMDAWKHAEPHHGVTANITSYVATFVDMARAIINTHVAPSPRITEQELKVIKNEPMIAEKNLTDGFGDLSPNCYRRIIKICRALLNKLNANTVAEVKQEPWSYCPECGSEEIHYQEGNHKQCARCHQEWFSDIDYTETVMGNLAKTLVPAQAAAIPEKITTDNACSSFYRKGWNDCIDTMLSASPKPNEE